MELVKLAVIGKGDKRPFVYPLLSVARDAAKTCLITDDPSYRRLYPGYKDTGEIEGIKIRIIPHMPQNPGGEELAVLEKASNSAVKDGCDCIIYVFDAYAPKDTEKTLAVITQTRTFLGWEMDEYVEEHPGTVFAYMSMFYKAKPGEVRVNVFEWKMPVYAYLTETEEYKKLMPFRGREIGAFLAKQFAAPLNITESCFLQRLTRVTKKKKG
jgi:hypothetical protein